MKHFHIITNEIKDKDLSISTKLQAIIEKHGGSSKVFLCNKDGIEKQKSNADFVLVLGGDGTFKEVINAKSFVILPLSIVDNVAFSRASANFIRSALLSNSPRLRSAPVHAKIVATEFVDVSSPFRCL